MKIQKKVYAYYVVNKNTGKVVDGPFPSRDEARYYKYPRTEQIVRFAAEKVVR